MLPKLMSSEIAASILLVLLAGFVGWFGSSAFQYLEIAAERLSQKKSLTILITALLPVALRLALLPWLPIPFPQAHDEFSHLLAADTFAQGRLTNPVPPLPSHFESMLILARPAYVSIFPPAQGLFLALGKLITNCAWAGVLLSVAVMTASVCWMLQSWTSAGWALLGTALLVIRLGVFSYWVNSYWGGAVAATGGALVLGALHRLKERRSVADSTWLGIGIAVLAHSRPFEGAVFTALCVCFLLYDAKRLPILWPAFAIVLVAVVFIGFYSFRITGNPFLPPYVLYRTTATNTPHFVFQTPRSEQPPLEYQVLRDFSAAERYVYDVARARPFLAAAVSAEVNWRFYIGFVLSVPLLAALRNKRAPSLFGLLGLFFLLALALQPWHNPHYAAPATGLLFLLITLGMQQLRSRQRGPWLTRTLVIASLLFMVKLANDYPANNAGSRWSGWQEQGDLFTRGSVTRQLPSGRRHLVVVRYGMHHDPSREWVYNEPDVERAPVVWARDKGPFDNDELLQHFKARQIWLLEPDRAPPRLSPYPAHLMIKPEELANRIMTQTCAPGSDQRCTFSCDQWNFYFSRFTGLEAPDVFSGCTDADHRATSISFQQWLLWIRTKH